jgi:hypothetical protein
MNDKNGLQIFVYESNKNKIKQPPASQLGILPKLHCTYIICGRSGSGKTQVCLNLLNSKSLLGGSFDEIYYFCDSPDDLMKDHLKIKKENFIKKWTESDLENMISKQRSDVEKKGIDKAKSICYLFDDVLSKKKFLNSNIVKKLVCECRHYAISVIFNTQSYKLLPRVVRLNASGIILFPSNLNELIKFSEEQCLPNMSQKKFLEYIQYITSKPHQFAFINNHADIDEKLRKNFDTIIK